MQLPCSGFNNRSGKPSPALWLHPCYAFMQGGSAVQAFFQSNPIGQGLLERAKNSSVGHSIDNSTRAIADMTAQVADKLRGPLQNLTQALADLGGTVAQNLTNLALKRTVEVINAAEPLIGLGVNVTQRFAKPIADAGQRLAATSFQALVQQIEALPAGAERDNALRVLQPRLQAMGAAGGTAGSDAPSAASVGSGSSNRRRMRHH